MQASKQIKKGRANYYIVICYKDEVTNKNKQKWVPTDIPIKGYNARKADDKCAEVLQEFKAQLEEEKRRKLDGVEQENLSKDVLFAVFIKEWLENLKYNIKPTTYDAYRINVYNRILPYFEPRKLKVKEITPTHIQKFTTNALKAVSPNTVRKYLVNISKCLDSAVKQDIIASNPVKRIDLPKKVKYNDAKIYNESEIERLLEYSKGDPLEIVILLTVFYGLRRSEALGIKWDAVDFENNTLTIKHTVTQVDKTIHRLDSTKNDSSYATLPLPNIIKARLKEWKLKQTQNRWLQPNNYVDEGYICTQIDGSLIKPNYVTQHFKLLLKKHNFERIRFHDLRHSSASYLLSLGFNLKEIQTWLRHSDIQTTMNIYCHLDMEAKRQIGERLNEKFKNFR